MKSPGPADKLVAPESPVWYQKAGNWDAVGRFRLLQGAYEYFNRQTVPYKST